MQNKKIVIFHSDLDNTLIYSYKHDIGRDKVCVELYEGREISYVTKNTYDMLKEVIQKVLFVPTTTRSVEQYQRIDLGIGTPQYALVCNGGVLLINGREDWNWYQNSLLLIQNAEEALQQALFLLEHDRRRTFELRFIRDLFVFTKCDMPFLVVYDLKRRLDLSVVDVFNNGNKIYVVPKALSKGESVVRFGRYIGRKKVIAAGDSAFDISMLAAADIALAPQQLIQQFHLSKDFIAISKKNYFSDALLAYILNLSE